MSTKTTAGHKKIRTTNAEMTAQTQARILQTTKLCLAELGYAGTTLTGVAKRLGLTQPALSYHFANKFQLMAAVANSIYDEMAADFRVVAPASLTAAERILAVFEAAFHQSGSVNQMALVELLLAAHRDPQCREAVAPVIARRDLEFQASWQAIVEQLSVSAERLELLRDFGVSLYRGMTVCRSMVGDAPSFAAQHAIVRRLVLDAL
ncbi:TetR/AcrR family transcriptional regulator [Paucibacter soli]|uniref:TetR/AcrR family transcriptional regulator n=1 Tax=Paucibacter soli TaxID=3133433 RepID=UPI0030AE3602